MARVLMDFSWEELFNPKDKLGELVELLIYAAIAFVVTVILLQIEKRVTSKKLKDKKNIQLRFVQNLIRGVIITIALIWVLTSATATENFGKVFFQGTTILAAVVGLAARPAIEDLFCGLMISINKPFQIGDRIELDNGISGIVMDITPRHVVLRTLDTADAIIPNSKLNACVITNMSHETRIRSKQFRIQVAYGTDVPKAMAAIRRVVEESEYTIPAWKGKEEYGPVHFLNYKDSSLELATTVYYQPTVTTELMTTDINLRIDRVFREEGIEIPFKYVNMVVKQDTKKPEETGEE